MGEAGQPEFEFAHSRDPWWVRRSGKEPRLWVVFVLAVCGFCLGAEPVYRFSLWVFDDHWRLGMNHAYVEPVWLGSWVLLGLGLAGVVRGAVSRWRLSFLLVMVAYVLVGVLGIWMVKVGGLVDYYDYIQGSYPPR